MTSAWKVDGLYNADPNEVRGELDTLGDEFTLQDVVDLARDENTSLHRCFEWDDTIAAEKYRVQQAGTVVRMLVYVDEKKEEKTSVRIFYKTDERKVYAPTRLIVQDKDEYQKLLDRAMNELRMFKEKYKMLKELDYILELIK